MKSKQLLSFLGFGFLLLTAVMMGGCASTSTSTLYDTPNWMPDGRIICGKLVVTTSQQFYGGGISGSHSYVAAFYPSGTGEVNLFEGGVGDGVNVMTCSPTGEMIAGIGNGQIIISDYLGNQTTVPNTSNVLYLDWSPDATKLVYCDTNHGLFIINRDGTGKTLLTSEADGPISWRVGNVISYSNLYVIGSDGSNNKYIFAGRYPQNCSSSEIVCQGSDGIYRVKNDGSSNVKLFSDYSPYTLKLSFDDQKIVGGAFGDSGVWLVNIDGTGYAKIR